MPFIDFLYVLLLFLWFLLCFLLFLLFYLGFSLFLVFLVSSDGCFLRCFRGIPQTLADAAHFYLVQNLFWFSFWLLLWSINYLELCYFTSRCSWGSSQIFGCWFLVHCSQRIHTIWFEFLWNLLRLQCPVVWSLLVNLSHAPERNMYSAVVTGNSPFKRQVGELADGVKCISMPIFYPTSSISYWEQFWNSYWNCVSVSPHNSITIPCFIFI